MGEKEDRQYNAQVLLERDKIIQRGVLTTSMERSVQSHENRRIGYFES